ncbi:hypothetical protein ColTof4_08479 [Colletotrichum tofieldiae]|nr:hypothetical protein ColTof3_01997 [Colletotrichum tofieldiae]GKT76056.1 hypothetical protein ColTof4_08479 [Colletotrichum tofieldiae]GKT83781.1 hypothetical protein Ct61P_01631 [Colletotrichum tofieldiae]
MRGRAQSTCSGSSRSSTATAANQLIIGRLSLGHTMAELVEESARNEAGCSPGTMAAYFHHAITLELACLMSNDTVQMAIVKGMRA